MNTDSKDYRAGKRSVVKAIKKYHTLGLFHDRQAYCDHGKEHLNKEALYEFLDNLVDYKPR